MIKVKTFTRPLERKFRRMASKTRNFQGVWRRIRRPFRAEQISHFKEQTGPTDKWPERTPETMGRAVRKRQAQLRAKGSTRRARTPARPLGRLRQFRISTTRKRMEAWSPVKWSGVHQRGGTVGNDAQIPARPFLWIKQRWIRRVMYPAIVKHIFGRRR